jgi:hypothetical protein
MTGVMSSERRKSRRTLVEYPVWLDSGDGRVAKVLLADVSVTGARVQMSGLSDVPSQVLLRLSDVADLARPCQVMWTADGQLGLRFEKPAVNPRKRAWVA